MILACMLLSTLTALLTIFSGRNIFLIRSFSLIGSLLTFAAAIHLCQLVFTEGTQSLTLGAWPEFIGISFRVDKLSAVMVLVSSLVALCGQFALLSSKGVMAERKSLHAFYHFMMVGVYGSFMTADLFNLYVWFEVLLLSSFFLVSSLQKRDAFFASFKYSALNILSSLVFLLGIALVYASTGSLDFQMITQGVQSPEGTVSFQAGLSLLFIAFSIKAGLFPFHFWLPASYPATITAVAAVFSGLLTKVGLYAILRILSPLATGEGGFLFSALYILALFSMVLGVIGALAQSEIKSILSFHIISQVGYIALCLSFGTKVGVAAAIFYLLHHIIVKANLFFVSAYVERVGGSTSLPKLGGFIKKEPLLALMFAVAALSLIGVPPLSGFWAKVYTIKAGLEGKYWLAVICALLVSLLTLLSMLKIWSGVFWRPYLVQHKISARKRLSWLLIPLVSLNIWTLAVGLNASTVWQLAESMAQEVMSHEKSADETAFEH